MNRREAILKMVEGFKVKEVMSGWTYYYNENGILRCVEKSEVVCGLDRDEYELVKQTKKIKLWQYINRQGEVLKYFYVEDKSKFWFDGKLKVSSYNSINWIRTQNYIEVEVET